jgi:predicted 3-demethylubiquinone-9 3-methyltransferase (glyoxalase superfamily)
MQKITTFLTFKSGGKKAVDFYCSIFKDSTIDHAMTMPGSDQLLHAGFSLNGQEFMAMDAGDYPGFTFTDGISLFVSCNDQAEVDYYWNALTADGGSPGQCGWLKDQFGVAWQVIPLQLGKLMGSTDQQANGRVMQAMLKMNKLIIADLEAAAAAK